jgi:iron complex transport system substrate-binding protein
VKRAAGLVVALLALLALPGCGSGGGATAEARGAGLDPVAESPTPKLPAAVASADDRRVTVTDVSRIVPLWGNLSEVVFALGLGDHVVGRDVSATFAEAKHLPLVTRSHDVSAEAVLSLKPTLVLAQTDTGPPEALEHLRNAGVPVVVVDVPTSIDDIPARIRAVAAAVGLPDEGRALIERTEDEIAEVRSAIPKGPRPKVAFLYMRGQAGVYLIGGPGSGADSMIGAAGGIDAGTAMGLENPFTPLTSEALAEAAPDVILMTTTGLASVGGKAGLLAMPGVAQTPAGRDGRVVTVEDGLLYSFGARAPKALGQLIADLHPAAAS